MKKNSSEILADINPQRKVPDKTSDESDLHSHHSYRIASIGSSWAAFFAGYQPKKMPVAVQTK